MEDGENRTSFIKDVKIVGGKADTIYSALVKLKNVVKLKVRVGLKVMGQA